MIHEIIYEGNHNFPETFTVGQYQKVIFQNGKFSIATSNLNVFGTLEIYNIIWTNALLIYSYSEISGTNITFKGLLYFYGNTDGSLNNVTFFGTVRLYENSIITVTDAVFNNDLYTYQSSKLTITNSSLYSFTFQDNSEVNISYCSCSGWNGIYDYSIVTMRNFTTSSGIETYWNVSLTLINSSVEYLYEYTEFDSGNWFINNNLISGSGTGGSPTINVINSNIGTRYSEVDVIGSIKILINNSAYDTLCLYADSNATIYDSEISWIYMYGDSVATIINTTIIYSLWLQSNETVYLEDVFADSIREVFTFLQGNISGYNNTFVGAESWTFPKIIFGPNVSYNYYQYSYYIYDQVNLRLTDTSQIYYLYSYENSNVSLFFCYAWYVYVYNDANLTTYYSDFYRITGYLTVNITLFNSTVAYRVRLYDWSFLNVLSSSYVTELLLYENSGHYKSADSTIDDIIYY